MQSGHVSFCTAGGEDEEVWGVAGLNVSKYNINTYRLQKCAYPSEKCLLVEIKKTSTMKSTGTFKAKWGRGFICSQRLGFQK